MSMILHYSQIAKMRYGSGNEKLIINSPNYGCRKVVHARKRLSVRYAQWKSGEISFAEFDASVQGWINHVRYADSWGLRKHVLKDFPLR